MGIRGRRRLAAALLAAVVALGSGTPAGASSHRPVEWMECDPPVGGELQLTVGGPAGPGAYRLDGSARLVPCRTAKDTDAFTIATYAPPTTGFQPRVRAAGGALYEWLSPSGTVRGSITVKPDVYAVCLAVEADVRVQCYQPHWVLGVLDSVTPLDPGTPSVSWPAPLPTLPDGGGACPGCWVEHGVTD